MKLCTLLDLLLQVVRDQLAAAQAENQALKAQLFNTNQVNAQTNVLLAAINNISKTGS